MNSTDELLRTSQVLVLPIFSTAALLEQQFGDFFQPPTEGIYKVGETQPCMFVNRLYHSEKLLPGGSSIKSPITNFDKTFSHVVDNDGNLIIPEYMMKDKKRFLSTYPTVPARGIMLVEMLVCSHIESMCIHTKHFHFKQKIDQQLLDSGLYLHYDGHLGKVCSSLFNQIDYFMENDLWHIYFTKRIQQDLYVEKTIDFRIYEWTKANDPVFQQKSDCSNY